MFFYRRKRRISSFSPERRISLKVSSLFDVRAVLTSNGGRAAAFPTIKLPLEALLG
jgi:hypothetical protein